MAKFLNRVKMTVSGTPGTGTITLGAAFSNAYMTMAEAGAANATVYDYVIEDGNDFELGIGTYTVSGTTLSRDTVRQSKISGTKGTSKLTLSSSAIVYLSPLTESLLPITDTQTANTIYAGPSSGSAAAPTFRAAVAADLPTGAVLQCLQNTYASYTALTTVLPCDNTVPQSTEGVQVLSQAITPTDSTNKVLVKVELAGCFSAGYVGVAVFRGTTCIIAEAIRSFDGASGVSGNCIIEYLDSPATGSSVTYSVRAGPQLAGSAFLNGDVNSRLFGGVAVCALTLLEVAA